QGDQELCFVVRHKLISSKACDVDPTRASAKKSLSRDKISQNLARGRCSNQIHEPHFRRLLSLDVRKRLLVRNGEAVHLPSNALTLIRWLIRGVCRGSAVVSPSATPRCTIRLRIDEHGEDSI